MATTNRFLTGAAILACGVSLASALPRFAQAEDADTEQLYKKNCNPCHGPQGKGDGPAGKLLKPPPAEFSAVLKPMTDADIAKVVKEGGKAVGKAATMPAFASKLSDAQISSLVAYLRAMAP